MTHDVVISILTRDRVGIVATVTRTLFELEANVNAISQTVVSGYFTIILTAELPKSVTPEDLRGRLEAADSGGKWSVSVQPFDPEAATTPVVEDGERFILTLTGDDCPGILTSISTYLRSKSINIEDLYAYTEEQTGEEAGQDAASQRFILISELMVPAEHDIAQIQIDLENLWTESTVTMSLQHAGIFFATNEIDFRHRPVES
jgi:glycine cleavage system transcriptional repressor